MREQQEINMTLLCLLWILFKTVRIEPLCAVLPLSQRPTHNGVRFFFPFFVNVRE